MKITSNQQTIDKNIKTAESYATKADANGRISHLSAILIEADADKNSVTFTAESELSAIKFTLTEGVKVEESGSVLIPAARLKVAVATIGNGEDIVLEADSKDLTISAGRRTLSLALLSLDNPNLVPSIGDPGEDVAIFKSSEFVDGFKGGASAFESGTASIASNVYLKVEGKKALFVTRDGKSADVKYVSVEKNDTSIEALVNRGVLAVSVEQISHGEKVAVSLGSNRHELHFVVSGNGGERHIRIATAAHEPSSFRADTFLTVIKTSIKDAIGIVSVNRKDFLGTLKAADTICALNDKTDKRDINLDISNDGIKVTVKDIAGFDDLIDIKSLHGEGAQFAFRWNQFTGLFDSYPDKDELIFAIVAKDGKVQSIALIDDSEYTIGSDTEDLRYFALAAATKN